MAYRRHAYRRAQPVRPAIWQEGTTRLRDYRQEAQKADGRATRLLIVPSLVNRYYILDLLREQSFLNYLATQGFAPFVVDWDAPGPIERSFSLEDYISRRLVGALGALEREPGAATIAIGYCMGGMLTLALSLLAPSRLSGLVCLATPWDFHAGDAGPHARIIGEIGSRLEPIMATLGELPVDVLQSLFASLDPIGLLQKFRRFGLAERDGEQAVKFVALEDWLNDGVALSGPVARECLIEWYGANTPGRGRWRLGSRAVLPAEARLPALVMTPANDRIVPPESALGLAKSLPMAHVMSPKAGHIGMMAGAQARHQVWEPLTAWLRGLAQT